MTRTSLFPPGASAGPSYQGEPKACEPPAGSGKPTHIVGDMLVLANDMI